MFKHLFLPELTMKHSSTDSKKRTKLKFFQIIKDLDDKPAESKKLLNLKLAIRLKFFGLKTFLLI